MIRYANKGGNSGIYAYEIQDDGIIVQFSSNAKYLYNYSSAGASKIEEMKRLATKGKGLNSYIMENVKKVFASKLS